MNRHIRVGKIAIAAAIALTSFSGHAVVRQGAQPQRASTPSRVTVATGFNSTKIFEQTDASGKVTIAVFERYATYAQSSYTNFVVDVPSDYVVVGGGGEGKETPYGNLLTASYPDAGLNAWLVSSKEHGVSDPVRLRAWAIGLKISGLTPTQLRSYINVASSTGITYTPYPEAIATLPDGYTLLGGGFRVNWSGAGNLGTASAPLGANGWQVRGKEHLYSSPATATAFVIGLQSNIPGIGSFASTINAAGSYVAAHPAITTFTPSGHALTGCGAYSNWTGAGNLLWKIKPTGTLSGPSACDVSSKDHMLSSPTTITGYAIGLRGY